MGILIAIEGIDGAGKTTQVQLLGEALREAGLPVVLSREPTDGPWGRKIRESAQNGRLTLEEELHAFIEDRKEHIASTISPSLERDQVVILDRYFYSTVAYQGARGADHNVLLRDMKSFAPVPDIVFFLDADPAVAVSRISNGRGEVPNEFERVGYLTDVRKVFQWLASRESEVHSVDGQQSIQDVLCNLSKQLIDGVLSRFRAKSYDCDCLYCSAKEDNACDWFVLQGSLRAHVKRHREAANA